MPGNQTNFLTALNLGGNTLTMLNPLPASTQTFSGNLTGNGNVALYATNPAATAAIFILQGTNTYTGFTLVQGTAKFGNGASIIQQITGVISNQGVIQLGSTAAGNLIGSQIVGAGVVNFVTSGGVSGTYAITNANSYSGGTVISTPGRLMLSNDFALGTGPITFLTNNGSGQLSSMGTSTRTLANDLVFSNSASATLGNATDSGLLNFTGRVDLAGGTPSLIINSLVILGGVISNGGFTKLGASTLTISNANTYTGNTTNSAGTLALGADNVLGSGILVMNGGTLGVAGGGPRVLTNAISLSGASTVDTSGGNLTLPGVLAGSSNLIKSGSGTLTLLGVNLNSGVLGVTAGQMILGNALAAQNATVSNTVAGGLVFSNAFTAFTFGGLAGATDLGLTNTAGGGIALSVGGNNASTTFGGSLTGGNGSLIKTGSGSLILSNANLSSVGVSNGTLKLTSNLVVSSGLSVASGAIFDPNKQTVTGSVTIASGGWMAVSTTAGALLPIITGTVSNRGIVSLTDPSSSTPRQWGGLVNDGVFLFDFESGTVGPALQFSTSSSLVLNFGGSVFLTNASFNSSMQIDYAGGPVLTNSGAITIFGMGTNGTKGAVALNVGGTAGSFGGSNLLVNAGSGQIFLTSMGNTNTGYTTGAGIGAFLRNEGTLTVSGTNASQVLGKTVDGTSTNAGTGVIVIQGQARLDFFTSSGKRHSLVNQSGGLVSIEAGGDLGILSLNGAQNGASAGSFRNEGVVTNLGSIVTFFNLTNAAGAKLVSAGNFSTSVVNQGSLTFLAGASSIAGTLLNLSNATLQQGASLSLTGAFSDQGTYVSQGATNNFNGGATIAANGTFALTNGVSVVNGALTNNGLFEIQGSGIYNPAAGTVVAGSGLLRVDGGGTLNLSNGVFTVQNSVTNGGTIKVVNSTVTYAAPVIISGLYASDPSTNIFTTNVLVTASGVLSGSNGDLFVFSQDLTVQSTNRSQFNLVAATMLFTNGNGPGAVTHLFNLTNSSAFDYGSNILDIAHMVTNFGIGTLSIASNNMLTLTGVKAGGTTNALYVGWLDLQAIEAAGYNTTNSLTSLTNALVSVLSLPNINLYYDKYVTENAYLGGLQFDLWGPGSGLLIPIPEPSPFLAAAAGLALLAFLRRRRA